MNKNLNILMLEDTAEDAELMEQELRKEKLKFTLKRVETKEAFLKELKDFAPDIILVDYKLPQFDGITATRLVKENAPSVPVIIVTGTLSDVKAANCIKVGAVDYILKDRLARLGSAVKEALEMKKAREEKEKAEKELQESESKYRTLLENLPQKIFLKDRNSVYISCNDNYARDLKIKASEITGKTDYDFFPKELAEKYRADDKRIMESGKTEDIEEDYIQDGQRVFVHTVKTPVKDEKGKVYGILGIFWDITERKQMERMLIQSEKMASIGTLAAGVAHEINNPIGYIRSNLETVKEYNEEINNFYDDLQTFIEECSKTKSEIIKDLIDKFKKIKEDREIDYLLKDIDNAVMESLDGVKKVKTIVSDLKDFSREEKPEMKIANINDGIEKTLNVIWNELKYKAEVIKEFGDIPEIECDIHRLDQVFMNILVNAVQAIEKRGKITIKAFTENDFIVIQISDTGKGITRENIGKIFDAFYTTKEPGKGTGLGLSISYKIIQEHKGTIDVESEVGKGTTFTIKLPVRKYGEIKEYKILIVDDDDSVRELMKKMINKYNPSISVKTAKDGFEAGDLLNTFMPDVVMLDIKMPGMDGFEVCRSIKDSEKLKNIEVIMMTGFTDEVFRGKSFEAGATEFLKKPIKYKTLCGVLDKIIKG